MLGLIQLVTKGQVQINGSIVANIGKGIVALVGIEKTDKESDAVKMFSRIINYRIFNDELGKMNLSLNDVKGDLLLVPQFTLVAETNKGTRPGFSTGMPPDEGKKLFEYLVNYAKNTYAYSVESGQFGAYMQVSLCNDGPVTFLLKAK